MDVAMILKGELFSSISYDVTRQLGLHVWLPSFRSKSTIASPWKQGSQSSQSE